MYVSLFIYLYNTMYVSLYIYIYNIYSYYPFQLFLFPVPKGDEPLAPHAPGPAEPGRGALRGRGAADGALKKSLGPWGKPWKNHGKTMEKPWKNHGKQGKIHGKPKHVVENHGKSTEILGK